MDAVERLRTSGWRLVEHPQCLIELPRELLRYTSIPAPFADFVRRVALCENAEQNAWFLCFADYTGTSDSAFHWDEWERSSLDSLSDSPDEIASVRSFWNAHLPILMSVRDGYAYFAIRTLNDGFGNIVHGREPEFEEAIFVAESFHDFIEALASGKITP